MKFSAASFLITALFTLPSTLAHSAPSSLWISPETVSPSEWLSAPPSRTSAENAKDTDTLLNFQKTRTPDDCRRGASEVSSSLATFFGPPYGPLKNEEISSLDPFFKKLLEQSKAILKVEKAYWKRKRPFIEDPNIQPCVAKEKSDAYPSGHATASRLFAEVLSAIDPSRAKIFHARADQIALDRVIVGMHHPTDIEAGKRLATRIFHELMKNSKFKAELGNLIQGKK